MAYSDHHRALVAAAVERYGEGAGLRVLANTFGLRPSRNSVHVWIREQGVEPTDEAQQEIAELDRLRKAGWQASIDAHRDEISAALTEASTKRNYLGMQQTATALGILYDKLVPPTKAGHSLSTSGDSAPINLMVLAPPLSDGSDHRPVTAEDEAHRTVVESTARPLPEGPVLSR